MMKIKFAAAALAALVAGTIFTTSASAAPVGVSTHGVYTVVRDVEAGMCALATAQADGSIFLASHTADHATVLAVMHPELTGIEGLSVPVAMVIDESVYEWSADGVSGGIVIISDDTDLPAALINSTVFGAVVESTPLFVIDSNADFDDAMTATVKCAHAL